MKKIIIGLLAASVCLFSGCSDEDTATDSIQLSKNTLAISPDGDEVDVVVTSSGNWRMSGMSDWAHPSKTEGKSGDVVTFTVDPNISGRPQEVTFKVFTGAAVSHLKIQSERGYVVELLSDAEVNLSRSANTFTVKVNTDVEELDVDFSDGGEEWISITNRSTDIQGNTIVTFRAALNTTYDNRMSEITLSGGGKSVAVDVNQKQTDVIIVNKREHMLDMQAQEIEVEVESNIDFNVTITGDWIEQITEPEVRGVEPNVLKFRLTAADNIRVGKIAFSGGGATKVEVTVIQKNPTDELVSIPDANFRSKLSTMGYVTLASDNYVVVTETGKSATTLVFAAESTASKQIKSIEGIEYFPNLETIDVSSQNLSRFDISKLTKVTSIKMEKNAIGDIILGNNPVDEFDFLSQEYGSFTTTTPDHITVSSTNLKRLNLPGGAGGWFSSDNVSYIDISGCPALVEFTANRPSGALKTIYMSRDQNIPTMTYPGGVAIVYRD